MYYIEKLTRFTKRDITLMHLVPASIVFIAFFTVTSLSYFDAKNTVEHERRQILSRNVTGTKEAIEKRAANYEDVLKAATGLFNASNSVSREEWTQFINIFELERRYPGIEGIGLLETVNSANLSTHESTVRANGYQLYNIYPDELHDIHTPVVYIEPLTEKNAKAIGFDMYSDPARRSALEEARDTGNIAMTSRLNLIQDIPSANRPGLLMYVPLYKTGSDTRTVEQRRANIWGYIYAQFYTDVMIDEVFNPEDSNFAFQIHDKSKSDGALLYQSVNYEAVAEEGNTQKISQDFQVNNRTWTITGLAKPEIVSPRDLSRPSTVFWGGLMFSLFLSGFIYLLLHNRSRALMSKEESELQAAKDELLALASHQLRTPATGVKQYIGMLKEGYAGRLTSAQRKFLNKAYESNERQLNTINEMLVVAKADSGNIEMHFEKTDLTALVGDVIKEHAKTFKDRRQKLVRDFPRRHIHGDADSQYIRMAIENVVSNASKYTHEGGEITIVLKKQKKSVVLTVSDTGVGVKDKYLPLLFKKFSRIPNELTRQVSGTGIGLYLAKKIVDAHDGTIEFSSIEKEGSTCKIKLPLQQNKKNEKNNKR